ncbi:MAG: helix-turn-helix domain-containing protein [Bacteroidales bacterium]|jgi:transcriptional regulator with XRE-family HTH domain|nr:helix-turn-helix domain-containing protein [Bacteroidales bacterium]
MIERILQIMQEQKLSPSQFADEIGIQRSGISHLISGRNKPSLEFVMKVLKRFPEIKPEWLLQGTTQESQNIAKSIDPQKNNQQKLFEESDLPETSDQKKGVRFPKKEKTDRKIERIVVFYQDRTFREYEPE